MANVPLDPAAVKDWQGRIAQAQAAKKTVAVWWEANLRKYAPDQTGDPEAYGEHLNTNRDFTLIERKKADLFYQRPDVQAVPSPLMQGQEALLETHSNILNEKLGLDGVNAKALVHRVLFDVLCPSGTGWTVMGYESATIDVEQQVPDGEQPMPGTILGLAPSTPTYKTVTVPVPVYEECFWNWLSPKQGLVPHDARSTDWDKAAWLGYEFELPIRTVKRKGWVKDSFTGSASSADLYFTQAGSSASDSVARGVVIYYKSALYRDDIVHPLHLTRLVLIDGVDEPAEHINCPYQDLAPDGSLTPDSLIGFPIHPCTTRVLSDSAYVPSDATITRPTVNELNKFRGQMLEYREAQILRWMYNVDTLPPDALAKIVRSPIGGMIGVPGEAFVGEGAIKELPHGTYPRENFSFSDALDNDLARAWALDENQVGVNTAGADGTATEAQIQQQNANARLGFERSNILDWYLKGVTKYSTLLQRLLTVAQAAAIVGQEQAAQWDSWRKQVPASLAFTALPDSALRTDLAVDRKRALDEYSFFANDPFINRQELLKQLLPRLHYSQKVINAQPPPKGPDPAKPSFSFKGDDLNPLAPQFAIVMEILKQSGVTVDPAVIATAQAGASNALLAQQTQIQQTAPTADPAAPTAHGGKVPAIENLSKHAAAITGGLQGTGQPAPMGAGGSIQ